MKFTDLYKFNEFYKKMGVAFSQWENGEVTIVTVAQAHFRFDKDGKYVGVEADEMGGFQERKN